MAKRQRDRLKKKMAQIFNHLDYVEVGIAEFYEMFSEHHPELAESLQIAAETILLGDNILEKFSEQAWAANREKLLKYKSQ